MPAALLLSLFAIAAKSNQKSLVDIKPRPLVYLTLRFLFI